MVRARDLVPSLTVEAFGEMPGPDVGADPAPLDRPLSPFAHIRHPPPDPPDPHPSLLPSMCNRRMSASIEGCFQFITLSGIYFANLNNIHQSADAALPNLIEF